MCLVLCVFHWKIAVIAISLWSEGPYCVITIKTELENLILKSFKFLVFEGNSFVAPISGIVLREKDVSIKREKISVLYNKWSFRSTAAPLSGEGDLDQAAASVRKDPSEWEAMAYGNRRMPEDMWRNDTAPSKVQPGDKVIIL